MPTEWSNWLGFKIFIDLFFGNEISVASVKEEKLLFILIYFCPFSANANKTESEWDTNELKLNLLNVRSTQAPLFFLLFLVFSFLFLKKKKEKKEKTESLGQKALWGMAASGKKKGEKKIKSREIGRKYKFKDVRHVLRSTREGNKLGNSSSIKLKMIFSLCLQNRWRKWAFGNQISGNYANRTIKQGRRIMFAIKQKWQGNLFYRFFYELVL